MFTTVPNRWTTSLLEAFSRGKLWLLKGFIVQQFLVFLTAVM